MPSRYTISCLPLEPASRALFALLAVTAACTNADPTADAGPTVASEVGYYPMVDGARWTYVHKDSMDEDACDTPDACWNETVTLEETEYEGASAGDDAGSSGSGPAFRLEDDGSNPDKSSTVQILGRVGTMAMRLHKIDSESGKPTEEVSYDPGFPRFDDAWLELDEGTIVDTEYARTSTDLSAGASAMARTDVRMQQYEIEGREDVTVPAGTFRNCLKVRRLREASDVDAGTSGTDEKEKRFWFCDGVGKVREDNLTMGKSNQEVLLSCDISGGRC